MFNVQVTMNEHMQAMDWLEANLEANIFMFDADDVSAMVEQITVGGI